MALPALGMAALGGVLGTAAHFSKNGDSLNNIPQNRIDITGDSGLLSHPEYQAIMDDLYKFQALQNGFNMTDNEKSVRKSAKDLQNIQDASYANYLPSELDRGTWEDKVNPAFNLTKDEQISRTGLNNWDPKSKTVTDSNDGNWMNSLGALATLLALGGGAYYLGRRR